MSGLHCGGAVNTAESPDPASVALAGSQLAVATAHRGVPPIRH